MNTLISGAVLWFLASKWKWTKPATGDMIGAAIIAVTVVLWILERLSCFGVIRLPACL